MKESEQLNSNFNPFDFTAEVGVLLFNSKVKEAKSLVGLVLNNNILPSNHYRIMNALSLIKSVESHLINIDELIKKNSEIKSLLIHESNLNLKTGIPKKITSNLDDGAYTSMLNNYFVKNEYEPIILDKNFDLNLLDFSGFNNKMSDIEVDKLFIESNVRLSCLSKGAMTAFNMNGGYHPKISGRVAKASQYNAYKLDLKTDSIIDEAYILPFPHAPGNYYHCLSEIGYGFRYINRVDSNIPIICTKDKFGIVDELVTSLNINPKRVIEASNIKTCLIKKSYLPNACPFYWSTNMRLFFRNIAIANTPYKYPSKFRKVYLSRLGSSRSTSYEMKLEKTLLLEGFEIIYSEKLSFREQIQLFSEIDLLITHHGAGLANTIFSKNSIKILEIFPNNILAPDFYHRIKNITPYYQPVFGMNEKNYKSILEYL